MNFKEFELEYLKKYSVATLMIWKMYESKEPWTFNNHTEKVAAIFNKLPKICVKPLSEKEISIIQKLMVTMAYLPFTECISSFAFFSSLNQDWGEVLYEHAYDVYVKSLDQDLNALNEADQIYFRTAITFIKRTDVIKATASAQILIGTKV